MTLILTAANSSGVYQSSDYQLTDLETGAPVSDRAGCKQLQASFRGLELVLAFTGVASLGAGIMTQRTVDWLAGELRNLPQEVQLQQICETLAKRAESKMRPLGLRGVLEIVITVAEIGGPFRVAVISNVNWRKRPPEASPGFRITVDTITKPFAKISGYSDAVAFSDRHRLKALARKIGKSSEDIGKALAEINSFAARRSHGYISEACWVTSQVPDGRVRRSASRNIGQHAGPFHHIIGGIDLDEWVRRNFRAQPGGELKIIQQASVLAGPGDSTPVPPPTGEPRRFAFTGSTVSAQLTSPCGIYCATVTIEQLNCSIEVQCNEEVTVPFARISVTGSTPPGNSFARPLLPWPQVHVPLNIDEAPIPRGSEYSIGYWVESNEHRVEIPVTSRGIRKIAFLGSDDELALVVPVETAELAWADSADSPSIVVNARVWWRSRLDGTRD